MQSVLAGIIADVSCSSQSPPEAAPSAAGAAGSAMQHDEDDWLRQPSMPLPANAQPSAWLSRRCSASACYPAHRWLPVSVLKDSHDWSGVHLIPSASQGLNMCGHINCQNHVITCYRILAPSLCRPILRPRELFRMHTIAIPLWLGRTEADTKSIMG